MRKQTTNKTTYNGWENYETWLMALWFTNDLKLRALLLEARAQDKDIVDQSGWLQVAVRQTFDNQAGEASLWNDLMHASFNRIEWGEIMTMVYLDY